jgi:hypothetical protein
VKTPNIIALIIFGAGIVSGARATTITFDEGGTAPEFFFQANPLRGQYSVADGVTFAGPTSDGGGAILSNSANFSISAFSGPNFLAFNTDPLAVMANGGYPIGPETIMFATGQRNVSMMVANGASSELFTLSAYDSGSNLIDTSQVTTNGWSSIGVTSSSSNIASVVLSFGSSVALVDNLSFSTQAVPEPTVPVTLAGLGSLLLLRKRRG